MFWKRSQRPKKAVSAAPAQLAVATDQNEMDRAIDTLAVVLRAMGEHAIAISDLEPADVRATFDDWASRIVVGTRSTDDDGKPAKLRRDWGGVRRFFTQHRKDELEHVSRTLGDLRQAVQTFAACVTTTVKADRTADASVGDQLGRLSLAIDTDDASDIKNEAIATVNLVSKVMEERRTRHQSQLDDLKEQLDALRKELGAAREQMSVDPLTQLFNRASFDFHIEKLADFGMLLGAPPSLLMIDIDHFKKINDDLGHPAGDRVLVEFANCLLRCFLRKEDFVARYGGEEFAVVIAEPSLEAVTKMAERALEAVRKLEVDAGRPVHLTASIGVAQLSPGEAASEWLARADRALYSAKAKGRACVVVADAQPNAWKRPVSRPATAPLPATGA